MSEPTVLTKTPNFGENRDEIRAIDVEDRRSPLGGVRKERHVRAPDDRYLVDVLSLKHFADAEACNLAALAITQDVREAGLGVRFTLIELNRRDFLQRLVKLHHEGYAGKVTQLYLRKKAPAKMAEGRR